MQGMTERRKFLRLKAPVGLRIITKDSRVFNPPVKNFSARGVMFETGEKLSQNDQVEITLLLPNVKNPVHVNGKVIWHKKSGEQDKEISDVGCEFVKIEEDNKNTFLRFFCDLIYDKSISFKKED